MRDKTVRIKMRQFAFPLDIQIDCSIHMYGFVVEKPCHDFWREDRYSVQAASASPHTNCAQYDLLEVVYKGDEGKCFIIFTHACFSTNWSKNQQTYRNTVVNISRDLRSGEGADWVLYHAAWRACPSATIPLNGNIYGHREMPIKRDILAGDESSATKYSSRSTVGILIRVARRSRSTYDRYCTGSALSINRLFFVSGLRWGSNVLSP